MRLVAWIAESCRRLAAALVAVTVPPAPHPLPAVVTLVRRAPSPRGAPQR
ncbi:hypothetical protein [Anaeromyxobacter sp. Fw109-5]|nr:hypothetical protein [Anaeromyxobacter sp. Fw109-5]